MRRQITANKKSLDSVMKILRKQLEADVNLLSAKSLTLDIAGAASKTLGNLPKPKVRMTMEASIKQRALVDHMGKEIGWNGLVKKENDEYVIYDILVFPQFVTGVTYEGDDDGYATWLPTLSDEQFFNMRMNGHSHVNMGCVPSGTDTTFQNDILSKVQGGIYIFMIQNKKGEQYICLYDKDNNMFYDKEDIEFVDELIVLAHSQKDWAETECKEKVKEKATTYPYQKTGYGTSSYSGYYDNKSNATKFPKFSHFVTTTSEATYKAQNTLCENATLCRKCSDYSDCYYTVDKQDGAPDHYRPLNIDCNKYYDEQIWEDCPSHIAKTCSECNDRWDKEVREMEQEEDKSIGQVSLSAYEKYMYDNGLYQGGI